ncbi:MAG TPA: very short patch repair endonuclease [Bacillota bacterium]|nr:very short patch repair endonuclease [Bacillota bacterium]
MTDKVDPETRSRIMARVRGKNTKPELTVRKALHAAGFRFRLHRKDLPGNPDVTLPRYRTAVFVHGCFWHGHNCSRFRMPSSNVGYWQRKIERNKERDAAVLEALERMGWRVWILWSCNIEKGVRELIRFLEYIKNADKDNK